LYPFNTRFRLRPVLRFALLAALCLALASCKHSGPAGSGEVMYVSAPQANLRDHVSTIYNRVGSVKNGDRVVILERQRRFVRVRTADKVEGWIELRALVPRETYEQFQQLSQDNRNTPVQCRGVTRVELNMHVAPGRETDTLYQLAEASKLQMLKRSTTTRATPEEIAAKRAAELARAAGEPAKPAPKKHSSSSPNQTKPATTAPATTQPATAQPATGQPTQNATAKPGSGSPLAHSTQPSTQQAPGQPDQPKPMDDWWLVRDQQGHTGWVLARMVDPDIPLDVVQYAEGQRIQAAFVLNTVQDEVKGSVPQYLVLLNENRDGIAYDFNQVRVFTWNLRKHRYETGYREHYIVGYFPVQVSTEDFGKEGTMPVFTIRKQNEDGSVSARKYRVIGNVVRQVLAPGEVAQPAAHSPDEPRKNLLSEKRSRTKKKATPAENAPQRGKRRANHGRKH
jgi:SH3-like domain-containing protein